MKLSFKSFPFNVLYRLSDDQFSAPNQYITLWKYLIYSNVCKLLTLNEAIDAQLRADLESVFRPELKQVLAKEIGEWTKKGVKLKFPGIEVSSEYKNVENDDDCDWVEKVDILEKVIFGAIDSSKYFVMFDELDEDYTSFTTTHSDRYMDLLIGLFKATQDVVSRSMEFNANIAPVVVLRDDIYKNIKGGSDKTKWSDFKEEISWDKRGIQELLAYRISKAYGEDAPVLTFEEAWFKLFEPELIGHKKKIHLFDYISNLTLGRPRDYVHYLKLCCDIALKFSLNRINARAVRSAEIAFSAYLRSEFEDELNVEVENIHGVFNVLTGINKQTFTADHFSKDYLDECNSKDVAKAHEVLHTLYEFGVIGFCSTSGDNVQISVVNNPDSVLNIGKKLFIHRGLYKALQIY